MMKCNRPDDLKELAQRGYRFALSLTHESARAEDLVQDAWLSLLKAEGPWTPAYLFAAIRNRFVDLYRRGRLIEIEPLAEEACEAGADDWSAWPECSDLKIQNGTLKQAVGRLRPEERAVLFLAALEERTAREIGELLDCPRGTVLSLMHRARHKLRQSLQSDGGPKA